MLMNEAICNIPRLLLKSSKLKDLKKFITARSTRTPVFRLNELTFIENMRQTDGTVAGR